MFWWSERSLPLSSLHAAEKSCLQLYDGPSPHVCFELICRYCKDRLNGYTLPKQSRQQLSTDGDFSEDSGRSPGGGSNAEPGRAVPSLSTERLGHLPPIHEQHIIGPKAIPPPNMEKRTAFRAP